MQSNGHARYFFWREKFFLPKGIVVFRGDLIAGGVVSYRDFYAVAKTLKF